MDSIPRDSIRASPDRLLRLPAIAEGILVTIATERRRMI